MKEIIDSILQAEEMAEQIIGEANERAKQIAVQRDTDSETARANAVKKFNKERKDALVKAENKAEYNTKNTHKNCAHMRNKYKKAAESSEHTCK